MFHLMKDVGFSYSELLDMEHHETIKWLRELENYNERVYQANKEALEGHGG